MTGFPVTIFTSAGGQARHRARNGQTIGRGRSRASENTTAAAGSSHHRTAGRNVKGTNRSSVNGGYRMSPALIWYGPASWYGSKYEPPWSQRVAASMYSR